MTDIEAREHFLKLAAGKQVKKIVIYTDRKGSETQTEIVTGDDLMNDFNFYCHDSFEIEGQKATVKVGGTFPDEESSVSIFEVLEVPAS